MLADEISAKGPILYMYTTVYTEIGFPGQVQLLEFTIE